MSCDLNDRSFVVRFFDSFLQERNIKWMLGLGTLILFGSSVKLISTHWNETSAAWKHVILLAYTAVIFITARQCFWRLGLRTTGTVLMALTVLLLPVTFLAWQWVWTEAMQGAWSVTLNLLLLGVNLVVGWIMAGSIFQHLLRGRQPTFVFCYLALAAAGAIVPQWHDAWPVAALALWGLMTAGTVKVHRHIFWLTEERRLPRIFGFFPIALLGTQFLLLFAFYLAPGIPLQWLGLACVLFAVPVLSTADAAAGVYRQRTGNLVRPIPLVIILPLFAGLTLCVVGICLSGTEIPRPTALVPTAAIAAAMLACTAHRTKKAAFVWCMLACTVLAYNFSHVFFLDLARLAIQQGAHAVHEQRLPFAFYGLTYLPFLIVLTAVATWVGRRSGTLFAQPARRFAVGLSCLLLAAAFQHEKAVFPVSAAMVGMFALQMGLFRNGRILFPAIAAFVGAGFGLTTFLTGVCGWNVLPDMQLVCLASAAVALLFPGALVDGYQRRLFMLRHQPEAPARKCVGSSSLALRVGVLAPCGSGTRESSSSGRMAEMNSHEHTGKSAGTERRTPSLALRVGVLAPCGSGTRESSSSGRMAEVNAHEFSDFSSGSANKLCRCVSLGLTLLLAALWCPQAFLSSTPAELYVSEGLLILLLVLHSLVWQSKRLAEIALVFLGFGAVVHAASRGVPADQVITAGTASLLVLWVCSYFLSRNAIGRFGSVFGPAARNVSGVGLTLLLTFHYLPQFVGETLHGAQQIAWPCAILIVAWAFDAARRFASPTRTVLGCLGFVGLATAGLTAILGVDASREWLLATWGATALVGSFATVFLNRAARNANQHRAATVRERFSAESPDTSSFDAPVDHSPLDYQQIVYRALEAPLRFLVLGSLLAVAAISTVFFSLPARAAGAIAVAGFACLASDRRRPEMKMAALVALNWQLFSGLIEASVPGVAAAFPNAEAWLVHSSLALALLAAASALVFTYLAGTTDRLASLGTPTRSASEAVPALLCWRFRLAADVSSQVSGSLNDFTRELIQVQTLLMHGVTAGTLAASLGLWAQGLDAQQVSMAVLTFTIVIAGTFWQACRVQDVKRVWIAEALTGVAFVYFILFGVIQLESGAAPFILLGTGFALWGVGQSFGEKEAHAWFDGRSSVDFSPHVSTEVETTTLQTVHILAAVADDTNPKRQRGSQLVASLALRVSMECAIAARGQYNRPVAILSQPFLQTGMLLPLAAVVLATARHLIGASTTMLGMNSLVLLAAAAFYFWNGLELRQRRLVVLSSIILNCSLALLWRELSWTDPQLFLIPLGLSVLGLVELLQAEIPGEMHNPLRYAGALVILVSPTFHIITGSWVHLFTLMAASVLVTLLSIGLRVRALMYTGVAFLIADIFAMLVRGSIDRPNLLWIAGIGLGTAVLALGALCENRREVLMQRLRILTSQLESWR